MSIEAMKQALEALEESQTNNDTMEFWDRKNNAITALRTAIAEAEKQEPVAWRVRWTDGSVSYRDQEPSEACQKECEVQPLYTTPPAAQRQPLTDEQIMELWKQVYEPGHRPYVLANSLARAIEAAHGITGEKPDAA